MEEVYSLFSGSVPRALMTLHAIYIKRASYRTLSSSWCGSIDVDSYPCGCLRNRMNCEERHLLTLLVKGQGNILIDPRLLWIAAAPWEI